MDSPGKKFVHYSGSSSSLSEIEDDWTEKLSLRCELTSPFGCPRVDSELCQCVPKTNKPSKCCYSDTNANTASTSEMNVPESGPSKQLVTVVVEGKKYILPFELIAYKQIHEKEAAPKEKNHRKPNRKTVELICNRVDSELVVRKQQLCGDFSFTKPAEHCLEIEGNFLRCSTEQEADDESAAQDSGQRSEIKSAKSLGVSRQPIYCPINDCQELVCPGYLPFHLTVDHSQVMRSVVNPGEIHNILMDPSLDRQGVIRCNRMFFLNDKLSDLGYGKFKNQLPVLLMSTQLIIGDLNLDPQEQLIGQQYMLWFTGIASERLNTEYKLCIGSHKRKRGFIHSLGQPQTIKTIYQSGAAVIISQVQLERLLRPEDNLLSLTLSLI